jgi:DNA primase
MRADEFVTKLKGVKPKGRGKWMACCPAHDDSDPSLAVSEARNGNILLKCFSGCSALDITNALGLRLEDLFADAYEEPPMAFAQREMAAKQQLEQKISHAMSYLQILTASIRDGKSVKDYEIEKGRHYKKFLEEQGAI